MHTIAEAISVMFSFIENEVAIQDEFAQCIGGLLVVAVQEPRLNIACVDMGVPRLSRRSSPTATRATSTRTSATRCL
nr:hypothetical protein [Oryza punctata]